MTPANHEALLARIRGASQRATDAIVAEFEPRAKPADVIRPVAVRTCADPEAPTPLLNMPTAAKEATVALNTKPAAEITRACETSAYRHSGGESEVAVTPTPDTEVRTLVRFSASEDFMTSYRRFQSLVWHRLPAGASIEETLKLALDAFINANDPARRQERREARSRNCAPKAQPPVSWNPRHIPAAARVHVHLRDKGRCTYVSSDGRRCTASVGLQIDHVVPVALGGASTPHNLRLLCAAHNRCEAERVLGMPCGPRSTNPPR